MNLVSVCVNSGGFRDVPMMMRALLGTVQHSVFVAYGKRFSGPSAGELDHGRHSIGVVRLGLNTSEGDVGGTHAGLDCKIIPLTNSYTPNNPVLSITLLSRLTYLSFGSFGNLKNLTFESLVSLFVQQWTQQLLTMTLEELTRLPPRKSVLVILLCFPPFSAPANLGASLVT